MDQVRPYITKRLGNFPDGCEFMKYIFTAAAERDGYEPKPFPKDLILLACRCGCNPDLRPTVSRRPRDRETMRQEEPIHVHEKQDARGIYDRISL